MKYSDIMSRRTLPFVKNANWHSGTAFVHVAKTDDIFVTQYTLTHDIFELQKGRLEATYDVRRVGRGEAGYLKRTGVNAAVATFEGAVSCKITCLSATYAVNAVKSEVEMLYEFLRGFTGQSSSDDDSNVSRPDPRIKIAENIPQNFSTVGGTGVFNPTDTPFMPARLPPVADPGEPFAMPYTPVWFKNYFVLDTASFKPTEPLRSLKDVTVKFSFSMRQIPVSSIML